MCWCWSQSIGEVWALCSEMWWTRGNTYISLGSAASLGLLGIVHWVSTSHLLGNELKKTGRHFTQQCLIWKETSFVVKLISFVPKQVFDNKQNNHLRWITGNDAGNLSFVWYYSCLTVCHVFSCFSCYLQSWGSFAHMIIMHRKLYYFALISELCYVA